MLNCYREKCKNISFCKRSFVLNRSNVFIFPMNNCDGESHRQWSICCSWHGSGFGICYVQYSLSIEGGSVMPSTLYICYAQYSSAMPSTHFQQKEASQGNSPVLQYSHLSEEKLTNQSVFDAKYQPEKCPFDIIQSTSLSHPVSMIFPVIRLVIPRKQPHSRQKLERVICKCVEFVTQRRKYFQSFNRDDLKLIWLALDLGKSF